MCRDGGPAPTLALHIFCFVREWAGVSGRWSCSHPCPVVFVWATLRLGNRVCVSGRWSCSDPCLCGVWGTGFACRDGGPTPAVSWFRAQSHQLRLFLIFYKFTHVLLQTFLSHYQMGILSQELVSIYAHFSFLALVGCTFRLQGQLVKGWAPH